ncbi:MAG TPA: hypothetical protein VHA52_04885, partial [Candidatus Babeliaceae bacterium]|nr:hypothetical protein [Candidatus Babeliaceae bacterium]
NAYPYTSANGYVGSLPMQVVAQRPGQADTYYLYSTASNLASGLSNFTQVGKVNSGPVAGQTFFVSNDNPTTGIVAQDVQVIKGSKLTPRSNENIGTVPVQNVIYILYPAKSS